MSRLPTGLALEDVGEARLPEAVAVHCDAFFDYPTMRFVLGASDEDYAGRLATLIGFFLATTHLKGGFALGLVADGALVAAADAVRSDAAEPAELARRRDAVWAELGAEARSRYESYWRLTRPFAPAAPHYYLSMLGVRREWVGRGLARPLVEEVLARSRADPISTGVALETEDPRNVSLYEHFGFRVVGRQSLPSGVESWGFFRPHGGPR